MRVGLALGLILVVLAEMLTGTGGVGYVIVDMQRSFRTIDMYAWIVLLALFGYVLNAAFVALSVGLRFGGFSAVNPNLAGVNKCNRVSSCRV